MTKLENKFVYTSLRLAFAKNNVNFKSFFSQMSEYDKEEFMRIIKYGNIDAARRIIDSCLVWDLTNEGFGTWEKVFYDYHDLLLTYSHP